MAKVANTATRTYFDEFDLSGELNSFGIDFEQEVTKSEGFSDTGPRRVIGNYDHSGSFLGMFEPTSGAYDDNIFAAIGDSSDHYMAVAPGANAEGSIVYERTVRVSDEPRSAQTGGLVLLNFDDEGAAGHVRGIILGNSTETGAGTSTGINQGATTTTAEYQVVFRLITFTGTDITIKVQQSSDDGSGDAYADVSGLTSGSLAAAGVVRVSTTASTEAWKRLDFSTSGGFSSAVILVTAGLVTGTS